LIQSSGGDIDVAEKIVFLCRSRARHFRVIIPESAKSAATLIALANDQIVMSDTSELGPIDPQVIVTTAEGKTIARPAQSFLDGLDEIKREASKQGALSPAYFPLLVNLDPALLDFCRKSIKRSERFAAKWLNKSQCKGNAGKSKKIAKALINTKRYLSHGAVIDYDEARKIGLNVKYYPHSNEIWQRIWRLHCRYETDRQRDEFSKIFESNRVSLAIG